MAGNSAGATRLLAGHLQRSPRLSLRPRHLLASQPPTVNATDEAQPPAFVDLGNAKDETKGSSGRTPEPSEIAHFRLL